MATHRRGAINKLRPHLNRRQRRAGASMNPIAVYARKHGLTLTALAALLGVSRTYLSDVVNCRFEAPATLLALFAKKTGLEQAKVEADYKRTCGFLEEMDDGSSVQEIVESDNYWISPIVPENPMRKLLSENALEAEALAREVKDVSPAAIRAILENRASLQDAEKVFISLKFQKPLWMAKAGVYCNAIGMYRARLRYEEKRQVIEERFARVNSWIDLSQPREPRPSLAEPTE